MSKKAEEKALDVYPKDICGYQCGCIGGDSPELLDYNKVKRNCYQQGYEQAEKNLALTWEDISNILNIDYLLNQEIMLNEKVISTQEFYTEVLRRFNESKAE